MSMTLGELKQLAYIHNDRGLFEVVSDPDNSTVELENCRNLYRHDAKVPDVLKEFTLVRAAPSEAPDQPPRRQSE